MKNDTIMKAILLLTPLTLLGIMLWLNEGVAVAAGVAMLINGIALGWDIAKEKN